MSSRALIALVFLVAGVSACGGESSGAGSITTVVGTGDTGAEGVGGRASQAQLRTPNDLAFDPDGNMYIAERFGSRIVKVDAAGTLTVFAGTGESSFSGDGGPAASAALNGPSAVATDADGRVYIADALNHRVRVVDRRGVITTIPGRVRPDTRATGVPRGTLNCTHPGEWPSTATGAST